MEKLLEVCLSMQVWCAKSIRILFHNAHSIQSNSQFGPAFNQKLSNLCSGTAALRGGPRIRHVTRNRFQRVNRRTIPKEQIYFDDSNGNLVYIQPKEVSEQRQRDIADSDSFLEGEFIETEMIFLKFLNSIVIYSKQEGVSVPAALVEILFNISKQDGIFLRLHFDFSSS